MIVPTNGNSAASVAQPTSIGSSMRRRASANVQKMSAAQTTTSTRMRTLTAVLRPSLSMPKTPRGSMRTSRVPGPSEEHPAEEIAEREEHEDNQRDDDGDQRHHLQDAGAARAHSADAFRRPGSESRSATR